MAEQQFQERTEQATPKRLQEAKDKGQVARSRELNTMAVTLAAAISLMLFSRPMIEGLVSLLKSGLDLRVNFELSPRNIDELIDAKHMLSALSEAVLNMLWMLFPYFVVLIVVSTLAPLALGGWSFSWKAIAFKLEKLNPLKGLKRVFAMRGLMELLKALAKFVLIAGVGSVAMMWLGPKFIGLGLEPIKSGLAHAAVLCGWFFVILSSSLVVIAVIDVPFQIWDHAKQLKMTKQEVKDEAKETEVNPELKGRIRAIQQQMATGRMLQDVPSADVVITNPSHYAVALKYIEGDMKAPKVLAKGIDHLALKIRQIAQDSNVLVFEAPPLARSIYASTKVGTEIPARLYVAVAQVLIYVHQLRRYKTGEGEYPNKPVVNLGDEGAE
ncbi:MAG: flagellar biosynthesis protein FlhB [Pseudomonadota bacterium]